ncbi:transcriptional antiterminator [Streptomyces sp. NPDC001262]|uniref:transcriptional antiterminator n=1 Tax=unclassified Streptomyces TaxID=2593676 RepID=UPI0036950E8B
MDERLAQRVRMFREGGHVPLAVVEFVVNELHALAAAGRCVTEDTAGMLTSHLMMALTRLAGGQPTGQSVPDTQVDAQVTAELKAHPEAVAGARAVAARARADLGVALPEPEIGFLGLHLAVLAQHSLAQHSYDGDGDIEISMSTEGGDSP